MDRQFKRGFLVLLITVFVLQMAFCVQPAGFKAFADSEYDTVLAFTSDVHNGSGNESADRLGVWIDTIRSMYGKLDGMGFCGDMGSVSNTTETQFWQYAKKVIDTVAAKGVPACYTTGNHEFYPGNYNTTTNSVKNNYIVGAEGLAGDNYRIYCLGTDNWNNNQDNYTQAQVEDLSDYLSGVGNDKPIIVLTHFPLHRFSSRTTTRAYDVIEALNAAAATGKKIVLLWGHNHSQKDPNYDQIYSPGDSIEYKSGSTATVNFYYAAAGCMSDTEYVGSESVKGKGLVLTIEDSDDRLSFTYYNANGQNVTEPNYETIYEPVPIALEGISIPETLSVSVGSYKTLSVDFSPADASNKAITWTTSDEDIVSVNAKGEVSGMSPGTAVVTATAEDGGFTDSCQVMVSERTVSPLGYVITIGNQALSANPSAQNLVVGSDSQISNYTGLSGIKYDSDAEPGEDILWTIMEAQGGYHIISQDGKYLTATYTANATGGADAWLGLSDEPDVWALEGTLNDWVISGSTLRNVATGKALTYEEGSLSKPLNLFTVRDVGETSALADPDGSLEERFQEVSALTTGGDYIIAVAKNNTAAYAIENVTGSSSGNTGSRELSIVPAEGSYPAYIVTDVTGVVWNYTTSNYLTNSGRYLSVRSNVPRASGTGAAVTYTSSNKRFSIRSGYSTYYLTNSNGTFGFSTSTGSAAQVRLFEKSLYVNFKYMVQWVDEDGQILGSGKYDGGEVPTFSGETPVKEEDEAGRYIFAGWSDGTNMYGSGEELPAVIGMATYRAVFETVPYTEPKFRSQSLVLSGKIGVNFNMDLPEIEGVNYAESYMTFDITGKGTVEKRQDFDPTRTNRSGTLYTFICYVNSIQMADTITATFHYKEDGKEKTIEKTYSVKEYIEGFDAVVAANPGQYSAETINLVHALADYGHYVQPFLSEARSWSIGTDYAEMDLVYTNSYNLENIKSEVAYKGIERDISGTDIEKITYSLTLDSDTAINLYFKMAEGYSGKFEAKIGEENATPELLSDGRYRVKIKGISAHLLDDVHNIAVTTDGGGAIVQVAALSYVYGLLDMADASDEYKLAAAAIYSYSQAAEAYVA